MLSKIIHAACNLNRGEHQSIRNAATKTKGIPCMADKLRQKNALDSAVTLAETCTAPKFQPPRCGHPFRRPSTGGNLCGSAPQPRTPRCAKAFSNACSRVMGAIYKTAFHTILYLLYTINRAKAILLLPDIYFDSLCGNFAFSNDYFNKFT